MGNSQPYIKLHYLKEENRKITGLVQMLSVPKGCAVNHFDVYIIGREKVAYYQNFIHCKKAHDFFKKKITVDVADGDLEPTFQVELPEDLPPSGHGGNYRSGLGYSIAYHVYVEVPGNTEISDLADVTVGLGKVPAPTDEVETGSKKFCGRTLEYEIPKIFPRGYVATLKFRFAEGSAGQNARIRLREFGKLLKGTEEDILETKYEFEEEGLGVGPEWTVIKVPISKFANTPREGKVVSISHYLELTAIGSEMAEYIKIPVTLV